MLEGDNRRNSTGSVEEPKWLATDPLDGAPFVVADILGQPVTGALSPPRLVGQLPLAFGPARIDVDDRDVALA
ncbi:MAG: hypothetical protein QF583_11535 [Rhodospirillales bacterium]|nr:hypothetical protein [Rhodospirillales bacterium]HIJ94111.1 hypothetical protein [Rhodospirillaceae bacterium]HJP55097.1 hypothetical protein [Rhodospirillales bacterium]